MPSGSGHFQWKLRDLHGQTPTVISNGGRRNGFRLVAKMLVEELASTIMRLVAKNEPRTAPRERDMNAPVSRLVHLERMFASVCRIADQFLAAEVHVLGGVRQYFLADRVSYRILRSFFGAAIF
jgi:hypothetical protein